MQHFCVGAALVKHLKSPDQMRSLAPETLRYMLVRLPPGFRSRKLGCYLLFPERVILELLRRLLAIHRRHEDVVEAELSGEHVHHDVDDAFLGPLSCGAGRSLAREPVQDI